MPVPVMALHGVEILLSGRTNLSKQTEPTLTIASPPIYVVIRDQLAEEIVKGAYGSGDQLPSERELAARFGVARMTIREALLLLEADGLVYREGRRGCFVAPPPLRYDPTNHINTFRLVHSAGRQIDVIVLDRTAIEAPEPIAVLFGCARGTPLYCVRGVAIIDGRRTSYEENYLLAEAVPGFLDLEYHEPITNFLIEHFDLRTSQTAVRARSVGLHGPVADTLRVTSGAPGWYVTRIKKSGGRIVQVDRDFWIANALEFTIGDFSG